MPHSGLSVKVKKVIVKNLLQSGPGVETAGQAIEPARLANRWGYEAGLAANIEVVGYVRLRVAVGHGVPEAFATVPERLQIAGG